MSRQLWQRVLLALKDVCYCLCGSPTLPFQLVADRGSLSLESWPLSSGTSSGTTSQGIPVWSEIPTRGRAPCPAPLRLPRPFFFKSLTENVPRNRRSGAHPGNCQLLRVVDIMVSHPKLSKRAHRTKYFSGPQTEAPPICRRANINLALVRHSAALRLVEQFWCFDFQSCRDIGNKPLDMKANDSSQNLHVLTACRKTIRANFDAQVCVFST